ncbi:hypothetical protein LOAG_03345 [Loa loa]|uniref:Uncharacterized protein n=1 Tax=Loa loa TaxID=7209 RepID=A0A1S0U6K7_LOALO|nr:hypothetical protein LOAG_03345 [Loa loa]EFO25139.2 hypothetical protein LOAG_03345 [Loa loa]
MACEISREEGEEGGGGGQMRQPKQKYDILEWEKLREKGNGSLNGKGVGIPTLRDEKLEPSQILSNIPVIWDV